VSGRSYNIAVLPGDFIGPEVTEAATRVLDAAATRHGFGLNYSHLPFGGQALDEHGTPLPEETRRGALASDAVLMGAAGGPQEHRWNRQPRHNRVESGILALRRELGVFANLRPVKVFPGLEHLSPLKSEIAAGTDMLIVRELTGGIYFGRPSENGPDRGLSTMVYERHEVERIARVAFEAARTRGGRVTSIDKANVLDVSQFWRDVLTGVHQSEFPDVELSHLYVDNAAMQIVRAPDQFDVIVTGNLFGDILSDLAAVIPGSLGLLPSASTGGPVGLFEPVHGSAPEIAGQGVANPVAAILSAAMLLRHGLDEPQAAATIEGAVQRALREEPTIDLGGTRSTVQFTVAVTEAIEVQATQTGEAER